VRVFVALHPHLAPLLQLSGERSGSAGVLAGTTTALILVSPSTETCTTAHSWTAGCSPRFCSISIGETQLPPTLSMSSARP
jgi:hypothetical protein